MTQEHKELLLKDLCARLQYGVKCKSKYFDNDTLSGIIVDEEETMFNFSVNNEGFITQLCCSEFKPYLFPLSSMNEEQKIIYGDLCYDIIHSLAWDMQAALNELVDWLNKNHFDYNNLIPKGLAIDATGLNIYQNYGIYTTLFYKKKYS